MIPFTTLHIRGLRISAFCGGLRKAEFEHIVIRKRTLAGLKAARARPRRRQAKVARRFGVSFGTVYKQVGAAAPEK